MSIPARYLSTSASLFLQFSGVGWLLGFLVVTAVGCAVPIRIADIDRDVPKRMMPGLVRSGVDALSEPELQQRVQHLLNDPQVRAMQQAIVAGLVDGTVATLSDRERTERIGALVTQAVTGMLHGATRELGAGLTDATGSALDAALSPERRRAAEQLVSAVVLATFRAAAAGLREAELGKQLHKSLREDLAPGLAELLRNEELNQALGATARRLGREMVLGATDGLAQAQKPKDDGSLLAHATELAHQGARLFGTAAWLLVLIIVALLVWTLKLRAQARSYREETTRRAEAARLLSEASQAAAGKPWADELLAALQERMRLQEEAVAALQESHAGPPRSQTSRRNGHTATPSG